MKKEAGKVPKRLSANEKYMKALFTILKKRDGIVLSDKKTHFNDTEIRLIGEVLAAKSEGKRLISTQIAVRLGVTRSAISQIVNRLENQGVLRRIPDAIDKKIAYIEITDEVLSQYEDDLNACKNFIGRVVKKFGKEKFEELCDLLNEFIDCIETEKK